VSGRDRRSSPDDPPLGLGGRLGRAPLPEMVEAGFALECADAPMLHRGFAQADLAQTVWLADAGYLGPRDARRLVTALLEMADIPAEAFPYDPALGDAWNSWHRELTRRTGPVAGWLVVGRPRREAGRVAFRIALRAGILEAHEAVTAAATALRERAVEHRDTVMADSTYLQPAQPTTLGHLLLGYAYPIVRDAERLQRSFAWVNRSPAGAGGTAGSSLPLDRPALARMLGFDGPVTHTRDAMWQVDGLVELLSTVAGAGVHAGQLASDLEVFASPAYGVVELDDAYSRASALMPQKKNPYPLAVVRGAGGVLIGRLTGLLALLRTGSARSDHFIYAYGEVTGAVALLARTMRLLGGVVGTMRFDAPRLTEHAQAAFLGAADLAEQLVAAGTLPHGASHELVGAVARVMAAERRAQPELDDLRREAKRLGLDLALDDQALRAMLERATDAETLARSRSSLGGAGPTPMAAMLRSTLRLLQRQARWRVEASQLLEAAEGELIGRARRYC
jgi:argininosuccinate lyase